MKSEYSIPPTVLSRALSHALRHEPWLYELELDDEGWVSLDQVLCTLGRRGGLWAEVDRTQVERMLKNSEKQRHELRGDLIRATYGHSLPGRLARTRATPPSVLLHGTSPASAHEIMIVGLLPMGRQYVHLSSDRATAFAVGRRKHEKPVVLWVEAARAHARGVPFYRGNDQVWLADTIPSNFISTAEGVTAV